MSFFKEQCLSLVNSKEFGILDDIPNQPAYVDEENKKAWLAQVNNKDEIQLKFYAIDNCIIFLDENKNKNKKSTCDAAIKAENQQLLFIELKDRRSSGWLSKATSQLKSTLDLYKEHETNLMARIECYVCNPQRPSAPTSMLNTLKSFKKDTGHKLNVSHKINISTQ